MCDRILVFSSNPGRVAAEIKVDLPHPRNRLDPTFRQLVDSIYARMTQRAEPKAPSIEGIHGTGVGMVLNHVSSNVLPVMGLIRRVLDERPSHIAPVARFRNELEDYMSEEQADETLRTIVSWARYAELFAYDEQTEQFSLENPH